MPGLSALIDPTEAVDDNVWWALRGPLHLAGTSAPGPEFDFATAHLNGLTHLVSLMGETAVDCQPLTRSSYVLEDLYGRDHPTDLDAERQQVTAASSAIYELLTAGEGVLVHCLGGTGRTGTVIGAVLCGYGLDPAAVTDWLDAVHKHRGHAGWPESPWQRTALDVLTAVN